MSDRAKLRVVYGILTLIGGLLLFAFAIVSTLLIIFKVFSFELAMLFIFLPFIGAIVLIIKASKFFFNAGKRN